MAAFYSGLRLGQRYVLDRPIGAGGMSRVWAAVDEVLDRRVAVKTLDAPLADDPQMRSMIRQEARAAAGIAHANVCQIYDFGEASLGDAVVPYLVMEHLDGENLADRMRGGPLPWREAVGVCAEVAGALAAAHALGVVHRDIKPANVMLTTSGAKVVDFGIAAVARGRRGGPPTKRAGTPAFLAPEVLRGEPASAQSDVYSLGALLSTALCGQPPLGVVSWPEAARAHERGPALPPLDLPGLPDDVRELCSQCQSPLPSARPSSADAAARLSAAVASPATPGVAPASAGSAAGPPGRGVGRATVRAPATALRQPTLLDSAPAGATRPTARAWAEGAAVATARRGRDVPVALLATAALVAGLFVLVGAAAFLRGQTGADGAASSRAPSAAATSAAPDDPSTPAGVIAAIEAEIASALLGGSLDADAARSLADDLRSLEQRIESGRDKDVRRRAEDVRERIANWVDDGEVEAAVGARLDQLLETLIRLSGGQD